MSKRTPLDKLSGEPFEVESDGQTYLAAPITIGDYASFQAEIRKRRLAAFLENSAGLSDAVVQNTTLKLLSGTFSDVDVDKEMATAFGIQFFVEKSIRRANPGAEWDGSLPQKSVTDLFFKIMAGSGLMGGDDGPKAEGASAPSGKKN